MASEVVYNQWFGKAVGFATTFVWAPYDPMLLSACIIAGVAVGHAFDVWVARRSSHVRFEIPKAARGAKAAHSPQSSPHLEFMFAALGHVAKRSGRVLPEHIHATEALVRALALDAAGRRQAIAWFTAGKGAYPFKRLQSPCAEQTPEAERLRLMTLRGMCDAAAIQPSDAALAAAIHLAGLLGFAPSRVASEFGNALQTRKAERPTKRSTTGRSSPPGAPEAPPSPAAQAAMDVLGVQPGASRAAIKRAYRKLVSKHHPDRLSRSATDLERERAKTRMVELRDALETLQAESR